MLFLLVGVLSFVAGVGVGDWLDRAVNDFFNPSVD